MIRMNIMVFIVTVILLCVIPVCEGQDKDDNLLYPWGKDNGDHQGKRQVMMYLNNTEKIRYFRKSYSNVSLCPGGRIGFSADYGVLCGRDGAQKSSIGFKSSPKNWTNIAIFGVTHNLKANSSSDPEDVYREYQEHYYYGHDYYEGPYVDVDVETLWYRISRDPSLLKKAASDVHKNFPTCHRNFKPKELLIVTWTGADDIDFCEAHQIEEPICSCMIYDSPFKAYRESEYPRNAGYEYCRCRTILKKSEDICWCYAYYGDMYFFNFDRVSSSWCLCAYGYEYPEEYCDCFVYGKCSNNSGTVQRHAPVKRNLEEESNTYQIVLMTNGRQTFAMFNYLDIDWIYINTYWLMEIFGSYHWGPIRVYAEVGFEQENGRSYHHPYSASDDLYKLVNETNTDRPGRWMYKISGRKVISPGCVKQRFD